MHVKSLVQHYNKSVVNLNESITSQGKTFQYQLLVAPEMSKLEILALRLYSGPMFARYNSVCRQKQHGVFSTTIWVINSGLVKLARITKATRVWRGVKGRLPGMHTRTCDVRGA